MTATRTPALDEIPGWFFASDQALFRWFLEDQRDAGMHGDLVEMGAYLGKSAVLIGQYVRPDETFSVIDLFESDAPDDTNAAEMAGSYASLSRDRFEANYALFHDRRPVVHTAPSSQIVEHVATGACRFVHVDASHLYEHVAVDVGSARRLLGPAGVVVFDDFRAVHTPGVAAAVWEGVLNKGMHPICVTESKMYATWSDPTGYRERLMTWLQDNELAWAEWQTIADEQVIRCNVKAEPTRRAEPAPRPAKKAGARGPAPAPAPSGWRKVARDWMPPRMLNAARRARARTARGARA